MGAMFEGATSFNQNIANWDVSSVDVMTGMFMGAESFDQNLSRWSVGRTRDMSNMFSFSGLSNRNYNSILLNWKHLPFFQEGNSLEILSVSITKQQ